LALRLLELRARALAVAEAAGAPALDAAAEARRRGSGVPLVVAVAEHVQPAQVDHLLEAELVAQDPAALVPVGGIELQPDLAARQRDGDAVRAEAGAQALGEHRRGPGHQRGTPVCTSPGRSAWPPNTLPRRIFFCSCRMP